MRYTTTLVIAALLAAIPLLAITATATAEPTAEGAQILDDVPKVDARETLPSDNGASTEGSSIDGSDGDLIASILLMLVILAVVTLAIKVSDWAIRTRRTKREYDHFFDEVRESPSANDADVSYDRDWADEEEYSWNDGVEDRRWTRGTEGSYGEEVVKVGARNTDGDIRWF